MNAAFAGVLAEEVTALAAVTDKTTFDGWRHRLIERATTADSAYAKVLRPVGDPQERTAFLQRWQDLIAATLARVVYSDPETCAEIDARQLAVSILAALYGGSILSRLTDDPGPLEISVELAIAPLFRHSESAAVGVKNRAVGTIVG
ncbi:hypothetical protein [Microbacterium sp. NPDC058345]|uniref:LmrA/YxaF family transcription factor n=1 Tax=Microbacterium sp. NPDC058345 TaxID=3346455 RepID=UPI00364B56A9